MTAAGKPKTMSGVPSGSVPRTAYGNASSVPMPSLERPSSSCSPNARPGIGRAPNGWPSATSVSGTGPDHRIEPSTVERITRSGAGPNPFWWKV